MTLRRKKCLAVAQMVLLLILSGACGNSLNIEPGQIGPPWGDEIDGALDAALEDLQDRGQAPPSACGGWDILQGLPCPATTVAVLAPVGSSKAFYGQVDLDVKLGKGRVEYEHIVALSSTENKSADHNHQECADNAASCAVQYVRWRMVLNFTSTINARVLVSSVWHALDVNLGGLGTRTGWAYCEFVGHPDPRTCGPGGCPFCGDGEVNPPNEDCDPPGGGGCSGVGVCRANCTCPVCGDGVVEPNETCETPGALICPGYARCLSNCTCPPPVPALPGWAGIALAGLLFVAGIFVFGNRRREPAT